METNKFIAKIKADGKNKDVSDLTKVHEEYKTILSNIGQKGLFSLNVLCVLCRNLDKVPSWRDTVDGAMLLTLTIDCVRETRALSRSEQVKTLACVYQIHYHGVRLKATVPPELILKLSYMPFQYDSTALLDEHCKIYWNILTDRMALIEKLKTKNTIRKLLPRLIEDALKLIRMCDTIQFCTNMLTFLVKKLHFLYNDCNGKDLQGYFVEIFKEIQKKIKGKYFEMLKEKEALDLYGKFNECFYAIAENASKNRFEDCNLSMIVSTAVVILGHHAEISKCLETFYLEGFCKIFENAKVDVGELLNQMLFCVDIDKNSQAMTIMCPFLNQYLRLYIEYVVINEKNWKDNFNVTIQNTCLYLLYFLSTKKGYPILKCDNCTVKSSLHDSLRLLFLIEHFPSHSIDQNIDITQILPNYYKLVRIQQRILCKLQALGCANHEKYFRKLQTDIHNTALVLNKGQYYEFSIKLFNLYVAFEITAFKNENNSKNISRALYNKSICQLNNGLYVEAIKDAFLSLLFSLPDGLNTDKYMSLVVDIKAKELKVALPNDESHDEFQMFSVVEAWKVLFEEKKYGNLKPFFRHLKFSEILKHEFSMYVHLWPTTLPIAGVWRALNDLLNNKPDFNIQAEDEETLWTLFEVVLETPTAVRTIHSKYFEEIITALLGKFQNIMTETHEMMFVEAALLFLKAEYDMTETSEKYCWKGTDPPSADPDQKLAVRTLPQEHAAMKRAIEAVNLLTEAVMSIKLVPVSKHLTNCLQIYQVWIPYFEHMCHKLHSLQLAHICLQIALHVSDSLAYIRAASTIVFHADRRSEKIMKILYKSVEMWNGLEEHSEDVLVFLCSVAIHYNMCSSVGIAARLLQIVQMKILHIHEKNPNVNLDLAVGRLIEAQNEICRNTAERNLSAVSYAQRHYLSVSNTATKWTTRRFVALTLKACIGRTGLLTTSLCRSLQLWRRARCACAAALPSTSAYDQARLFALITCTGKAQEAQTKIDNRLKHILGLQPSNETQEHKSDLNTKPDLLTPRPENLETMLENVVFRKTQASPSLPCTSVSAYKMPDFFRHTKCKCYACGNPNTFVLACLTSGLESSTYFRMKKKYLASDYFKGTLKSFAHAEKNLKAYFKSYRGIYDGDVVDYVERMVENELRSVEIAVLVEAAFFEISKGSCENGHYLTMRIHKLIQKNQDISPYLKNEVMNLMTTSSRLRNVVKKPQETTLEIEQDHLKINTDDELKTPITKAKNPSMLTRTIVKWDEVPNFKRKVIRLNLDDASDERDVQELIMKSPVFKIPVPVTTGPAVEGITPRNTRSKGLQKLVVTKPLEDIRMTPKVRMSQYYTPNSSPADVFYTPMTSMKTYSEDIVKNLEAEFVTGQAEENSSLNTDGERTELPEQVKTTLKGDRENSPLKAKEKGQESSKPSMLECVEENSTVKADTERLELPKPVKADLRGNRGNSSLKPDGKRPQLSKPVKCYVNGKKNLPLKTEAEKLELPKPARATSSKVDGKKALRRATSPGKLDKDVKPSRSKPRAANFNKKTDK